MKLTSFERQQLKFVFEAILPAGVEPRLPLAAQDLPLEQFIDGLYLNAPFMLSLSLRFALWVVLLAPIVMLGHAGLFTTLPPPLQMDVLERLKQSNVYTLRELPLILKVVVCMGYCGIPDVQKSLGITVVDKIWPDWAREAQEQRHG